MTRTVSITSLRTDGYPEMTSPFGRVVTVFDLPRNVAYLFTRPADDEADEAAERELQYDWRVTLAELQFRYPSYQLSEETEWCEGMEVFYASWEQQ